MSAEAVAWVYRHSPYRGVVFAVHLAIADTVNDLHDNRFYARQAHLAAKARVSVRRARDAIETLMADGYIAPTDPAAADPDERESAGRPVDWTFLFPECPVVFDPRRKARTPDTTSGGADTTSGVPRTPRPGLTQEEPKDNPTSRAAGSQGHPRREGAPGSDAREDLATGEWGMDRAGTEPRPARGDGPTTPAWDLARTRIDAGGLARRHNARQVAVAVQAMLDRGYTEDQIRRALAARATITPAALEIECSKAAQVDTAERAAAERESAHHQPPTDPLTPDVLDVMPYLADLDDVTLAQRGYHRI